MTIKTEAQQAASQSLSMKIANLQRVLNSHVLEREEETKGILLGVLSGTNTLFLGDVGTAKTMHVTLASKLLGLSCFDILLSETTKTDQIFGPVDIPQLAAGKLVYKWHDYAPGAHILFFDEIFKAGPTVLNPLLWLMNEHLFRDGDNGIVSCPTRAVFAASNEIPTETELKAVYDRMLLRFNVTYLKSDESLRKLVGLLTNSDKEPLTPIFSVEDVDEMRQIVKAIPIPNSVVDATISLRRQIETTMGYKLSDRRFMQTFRVMQANAFLRNAATVSNEDIEVMSYTAWQEPAQKTKVQTIVFASTSADSIELTTYMERLSEIRASVRALKNLRECLKELRTMRDHLETFSSQFAKQCLLEVNEFGRSVSNLLKARTTIEGVCVRDTASGDMVFKMHQHQNTLWRTKELSALGFRHKRKANYFYTKNLHGVRKLAAAKSVRIVVANEQKPRKHQ